MGIYSALSDDILGYGVIMFKAAFVWDSHFCSYSSYCIAVCLELNCDTFKQHSHLHCFCRRCCS